MSSEYSITCWLEGVRRGDPLAAEELWKRCFPELVRFARDKLRAVPRRAADEVRHLLAVLDDPELEAVALAKAEGLTNEEIAERFRCSKRTVARRLRLIRAIWEAEQSPSATHRVPGTGLCR